MAAEQILMNVSPGETRIALMEKGRLSGLVVFRQGDESVVGNIYLGRVSAVLDGLQAAFVECGLERAGFLSLADLRPLGGQSKERNHRDKIADHVSEGDQILVQVLRDPEENKGAKLTARVTLTGRDLVFAPGQSGVTLSRRISDESERKRLSHLIEKAVPEGVKGAFVVRVAAQEAEAEDLENEVKVMIKRSIDLEEAQKKAAAPACLLRELEAPFSILREFGGIDLESVQVDDKNLYKKLCDFAADGMEDLVDLISFYDEKEALFDSQGIEELIDAVLSPVVPLKSGGNIIISETPALTAIDVNTGSNTNGGREQNTLLTNQEAAEEIANQIQIRNLSGLLVIDFVTMRKRENQGKVFQSLKAFLADDPIRPHVVGFTKLGLLEMTRRRKGLSLSEIFSEQGLGFMKSAKTIGFGVLRGVLKEVTLASKSNFTIFAAPDLIDILEGDLAEIVKEIEINLGIKLKLKKEPNNRLDSFYIKPSK